MKVSFYSLMLLLSIAFSAQGWLTLDDVRSGLRRAGESVPAVLAHIESHPQVKQYCSRAGLTPRDTTNVLLPSVALLACGAGSYAMGFSDAGRGFFRAGLAVPVFAGTYAVGSSTRARDVLKGMPVVGNRFACASSCKGVCPQCKLTRAGLGIGLPALGFVILWGIAGPNR